jgi:hypothetical protein
MRPWPVEAEGERERVLGGPNSSVLSLNDDIIWTYNSAGAEHSDSWSNSSRAESSRSPGSCALAFQREGSFPQCCLVMHIELQSRSENWSNTWRRRGRLGPSRRGCSRRARQPPEPEGPVLADAGDGRERPRRPVAEPLGDAAALVDNDLIERAARGRAGGHAGAIRARSCPVEHFERSTRTRPGLASGRFSPCPRALSLGPLFGSRYRSRPPRRSAVARPSAGGFAPGARCARTSSAWCSP